MFRWEPLHIRRNENWITILYQDTGIYRNQQYQNASVINLKTTYEEIGNFMERGIKISSEF
mgnify:CR=1 FL=1